MSKHIFIPIKAHSARVPGKNFREFCGKPLYLHTLYKYENLDVEIHIDTDSQRVMSDIDGKHKMGELLNVHAGERREELRGDDTSVNLLIQDFLDNKYLSHEEEKDAWIAQIHVTTPFLKAETVMESLSFMESNGKLRYEGSFTDTDESYDSCASVTCHQSRLWRMDGYGYCPVNHNPMKLEKTQDLPVFYEENSCFYIFNPYNFTEYGGYRLGAMPYMREVNFPENMDIDTLEDWERCLKYAKMGE